MPNVLVVAADECIRVTCLEVLAACGFPAAPEVARGASPDVVLLWDPAAPDIEAARSRYRDASLVICSWAGRPIPPGATAAHLPFNATRVAAAVSQAARRSFRVAA
ncbi:MAG: hypothetical protein ACJ79R_17830 [Anaeromyxobacteraceae bacterium]